MAMTTACRGVVAAMVLAFAAGAAAAADRNLTFDEKQKLHKVLDLVEETLRKAGKLGNTIATDMTQDGDPGPNHQVTYDPADGTYADMIRQLRNMMDTNRMQVAPANDVFAMQTQREPGLGADRVRINAKILADYCAAITPPVGNPADAFKQKVLLGASFMNEGVHVFQDGEVLTHGVACDADRDSDTGSLVFLDPLNNTMFFANSLEDISAADCPVLRSCLDGLGVTDATLSAAANGVDELTSGYSDRRSTIFDAHLNAVTSWAKAYYGDSKGTKEGKSGLLTPETARVTAPDGSTRDFTVQPDHIITRDTLTVHQNGILQLVLTTTDASGFMTLHLYRDLDGDGLPEPEAQAVPFGALSFPPPSYLDIYAYNFRAGDPAGQSTGWTIINSAAGQAFEMQTDLNGTPQSPVLPVLNDPRLADGTELGLSLLLRHDPPPIGGLGRGGPPLPQLVLTDHPMYDDTGASALLVLVDPISRAWIPAAGTPTIAEAVAPRHGLGLERPAGPELVFHGNPGESVEMFDADGGVLSPVASAVVGPSGAAPGVDASPGPGLFLLRGGGPPMVINEPAKGANVACVVVLETADLIADRLHLLEAPPRLQFFRGAAGPPDPAWVLGFEQALESDRHRSFARWDAVDGRAFDGQHYAPAPIAAAALADPDTPLYFMSLHDFDGDNAADEGVLVRRMENADAFSVDVFGGVDVEIVPLHLQSIGVPFEPAVVSYTDLNHDGATDIHVADCLPGPGLCLLNDGDGVFAAVPCPCSAADLSTPFGVLDFFDVQRYLQLFSDGDLAADLTGDGLLDFFDVQAYLQAFSDGCP